MKKNLILVLIISIFPTICLYSMDQASQPQESPLDQLNKAQAKYYATKESLEARDLELRQYSASSRGLTEKELITQSVGIIARKVDSGLGYIADEARKQTLGLTEAEILEKEIQYLDKEIKEEQVKTSKLNNDLSESSKKTKEAEEALLKKQELNQDLDALEKLAYRLGRNHPEVRKKARELATKFGMDLPEEPVQEQKPSVPEKPKISLFTKLTTSLILATTAAGQAADFLASYSFAHITNLDYFKGTFIRDNAQIINRALVVSTIAAITYITYKKYKAFTRDTDDDFFDNDAAE